MKGKIVCRQERGEKLVSSWVLSKIRLDFRKGILGGRESWGKGDENLVENFQRSDGNKRSSWWLNKRQFFFSRDKERIRKGRTW